MRPIRVAFLTMEMLHHIFPEPYRGANFRGGLGLLDGDTVWGLLERDPKEVEVYGFVPLYTRPWSNKNIELDYMDLLAGDLKREITQFDVRMGGIDYNTRVYRFEPIKPHIHLRGIECPEIFDTLYTDARQQRFLQEKLLSIGAPAIMQKLKLDPPDILWLNESHTARAFADPYFANSAKLFTIHTPKEAGMEKFYSHDGHRFASLEIDERFRPIYDKNGVIDFTAAAMELADVVNAVSLEHAYVTKKMFPQYGDKIVGIRNGVNRMIWQRPEFILAKSVSDQLLLEVHNKARLEALRLVKDRSGVQLDPRKPTAWAVRRFASYKNLHDMFVPILPAVTAERGTVVNGLPGLGMQVVVAGLASESDRTCMGWVSNFSRISRNELSGKFVYLPEYNFELLRHGAQGSDVWLEIPLPRDNKEGHEACGTSGMRAALNCVPNIATFTGGMMEYVREFDPLTREGNGFLVMPYYPETLYEKLRTFGWLWYDCPDLYARVKHNAFRTGIELGVDRMWDKYCDLFRIMLQKNKVAA